jgi:S1/P1 Nuclease
MGARLRFPLLLAFVFAANPALAWGPEGHQIMAGVAWRELTPAARAGVAHLLGGGAMMVLDSNWADEIRDQRPGTAAWHYVNIEIGAAGYDAARDCRFGECVVAQIQRDAQILSDPQVPEAGKAEALRFLIHFVGDIHQPLHVADRHDEGGNKIFVIWHGKRTSLHKIWDTDVVATLGPDSERIAADIEARLTPQQRKQFSGGAPADWANESLALAQSEVYARLPQDGPVRLPNDYVEQESGIARQQLTKAGLRLAAMLNAIFR